MTRGEWLREFAMLTKGHPPRTEDQADALVQALLFVAATAHASWYRVGSGSIEELTNAAYDAMQQKAGEILTRN